MFNLHQNKVNSTEVPEKQLSNTTASFDRSSENIQMITPNVVSDTTCGSSRRHRETFANVRLPLADLFKPSPPAHCCGNKLGKLFFLTSCDSIYFGLYM